MTIHRIQGLPIEAAMLFAGLMLVTGCSGEEDPPCQYSLCDAQEVFCLSQTAAVVACKLDLPVHVPEARFMTSEELLAEWEAESEPLTEDQRKDRDDTIRADALMGLMPEGYQAGDANADQIRSWQSPDEAFPSDDAAASESGRLEAREKGRRRGLGRRGRVHGGG